MTLDEVTGVPGAVAVASAVAHVTLAFEGPPLTSLTVKVAAAVPLLPSTTLTSSIRKLGTRSPGLLKFSTTANVSGLNVAHTPMPRAAKPAQMSAMSAAVPPPAARRREDRIAALSIVGLIGSSFMPSVTNCRNRWLPVAKPRRVMKRARDFEQRAGPDLADVVHFSRVAPKTRVARNAPSLRLICVGSMSAKVSGLCGFPFGADGRCAGIGKAPDAVVVVVDEPRRDLVR